LKKKESLIHYESTTKSKAILIARRETELEQQKLNIIPKNEANKTNSNKDYLKTKLITSINEKTRMLVLCVD